MKLIYEKEYDGNPESLPGREHMPGAVKFKEFESSKGMAIFANIMAFVIMILLIAVSILRFGLLEFRFSIIGCILALVILFPHEILHAICFKGEVHLYTNWKQGMLFVVGTEDMSKARFVFMSLLPNLVFGFLPYLIYLMTGQAVLGTLGTLAIGMGAGDYYNVFNALTQMPRGARTYLHQFNSYWYMPEEVRNEK